MINIVLPTSTNPQRDYVLEILHRKIKISGCPLTSIDLRTTLTEPINGAYIIVLLVQTVRISHKCQPNDFIDVTVPSLIQIRKHCTVIFPSAEYINEESVIQGRPFHLLTIME